MIDLSNDPILVIDLGYQQFSYREHNWMQAEAYLSNIGVDTKENIHHVAALAELLYEQTWKYLEKPRLVHHNSVDGTEREGFDGIY